MNVEIRNEAHWDIADGVAFYSVSNLDGQSFDRSVH